jgi:4-amino-4-deoxy-L-arabinose transferase-like glycosyltransferase
MSWRLGLAWLGVLGLAVGVRLLLDVRSGWLLEGDDALSALMALGILDGERPIMLKNQTYAGAWEPYAMALSYLAFGVSRVSAKLPELLNSTALVATTWLLAHEVAGRTAAWLAALLMALPPVYVLVLSLKPWAPYTEVMLLGSLCLVGALRLAFPRPAQHDRRWALGCGVSGGLALWMHPLAVWYLLPAAAVVLLRGWGRRLFDLAGWGLLGFVVGALPVWLYNLRTGGATFRFVAAGTGGQTADRLAVFSAWWNADLPRGAGLWHPWGASPFVFGVVLAALGLAAVVWAVLARPRLGLRPLDGVLLLLLVIPVVLVLSGFGGPALNPYGFDATGRYAPPIWTGLAVVIGAFAAAVSKLQRGLAGLAVGGILAVNAAGVLSVDPTLAFQSPYWQKLPVDSAPLLSALRQEGVTAVWLNHWAGQPLMFDARAAGQDLVAYDWYDVQAGGIDRFPEYLPRLRSAARPAFVLVTDEARPALFDRLDALHVPYTIARVPPYVVVVPATPVDPSQLGDALDYRY